ncbi:hypothetical protein DFH09DRAFT_1159454 [Mycena vulgaris]|nr:hypothetical protein DFH09DRAFT_1159454 [Mycena vulgaris]
MEPPQEPQATELPELLGPRYLHQSFAEIPGIAQNWPESWSILRLSLQKLEDSGWTPHAAVLGLLHVEMIREHDLSLDTLAMDHLKEHLGTNYVPSALERTQIQELCTKGSQKLSKVMEEIEIDRCRLVTSNGRRVALNDRIYPYYALISPMRALPPEILQEIFMACLPAGHDAVMHTSEAPLLLGRICSAWRAISLSTPSLWSSLHLVVPRPSLGFGFLVDDQAARDNPAVAQRREGLHTWLQRSGTCPLSISVVNECTLDSITQECLDTILSYSRRLKSLALKHVSDETMSALRSLRSEDVPLLEGIEILDTTSDPWNTRESEYLAFYSVPPNLRTVSLKCDFGQRLPTCAWNRITKLCLSSRQSFFTSDLTQAVGLLEQCVNLESCRLKFPSLRLSNFAMSATSTPYRVTLSHLHALSVKAGSAVDLPFPLVHILDSFVVPALKTLAIHQTPSRGPSGEESVPPDVMRAIDELIERSSCALQALWVDQVVGDTEALLRCLHRVPALAQLDLEPVHRFGSPSGELMPVLNALIASPTSTTPPLCPNLTQLRLKHCDVSDAYHPVLQELIESRCRDSEQATRLQRLNIMLSLPSNLPDLDFWPRCWPSQVNIFGPTAHAQNIPDRARWGGIKYEEMGTEIYRG